ncbi:hypothetical protein [Candidatus Borreliella tachyglossi]|uniref:hypothetical protein n=1 Tax=Candidatus Borreliella tachyglossi TaxID=1964448 RepID=UPI00404106C5
MSDEFQASFEVLLKDETFKEGVSKVIRHMDKLTKVFEKMQNGFDLFSNSMSKSFNNVGKTLNSFSKNTKSSLDEVTSKLNSFSNLDFSHAIRQQGDSIGIFFDEFGMQLDNNSYKLYRFRETALRSFRELTRPISDFTKNAVEESAAIQNNFARLTMFLDRSSMSKEFVINMGIKDAAGNSFDILKRGDALKQLQGDILKFVTNNPLKNISYKESVRSVGTFLSGNMDTHAALVGLDMLSHAERIFSEIGRDEMTNYIVNSFNQIRAFYKTHGAKYGVSWEEFDPRVAMQRTLNTMSMISNKYKFNLIGGENPYKALSKSLTTNNLGAGFTLEELGVMAGTMTSAGVSASETDTAINNLLMRLSRAKKRWGTEFKKNDGVEMNLIETLSHINDLSRGEHKDKDLRDVITSLMEIFTIRGTKSVAISIPNLGEMDSQIKAITIENEKKSDVNHTKFIRRFQENAQRMSQTFIGSRKAFNTMVADFQNGYGTIARGFHWMALDIGTGFFGLLNRMRASENIFVKALGGGLTLGTGIIGTALSIFSDMAPMIIALTGLYYNKGSLIGMFTGIGKSIGGMGKGLGGFIKGLFVLGKANTIIGVFLGLKNAVWGFGKGMISVFVGVLPAAIKMGVSCMVLFAKSTMLALSGLAKVIPNMSKMFYLFFLGISENAKRVYSEVQAKILKMGIGLLSSKFGAIGAGMGALYLGLDNLGALDSVKEWFGSWFADSKDKIDEISKEIKDKFGGNVDIVKDKVFNLASYFSELLGIGDLVDKSVSKAGSEFGSIEEQIKNLAKGRMGLDREVYALGYKRLASLSNLTSALKVQVEDNLNTGIKVPSLQGGLDNLSFLKASIDKIRALVSSIDSSVSKIVDSINKTVDTEHNNLDLIEQIKTTYLFGDGVNA